MRVLKKCSCETKFIKNQIKLHKKQFWCKKDACCQSRFFSLLTSVKGWGIIFVYPPFFITQNVVPFKYKSDFTFIVAVFQRWQSSIQYICYLSSDEWYVQNHETEQWRLAIFVLGQKCWSDNLYQ